MTKNEYLPFHASIIKKIASQLDYNVYLASNNTLSLRHKNAVVYMHENLLISQDDILAALKNNNNDSFLYRFDTEKNYFQHVFNSGTQEQKTYYLLNILTHSSQDLNDLNYYLPNLSEVDISLIFDCMQKDIVFEFVSSYLDNTINLLNSHPNKIELISSYLGTLCTKKKYVKSQVIGDIIIKNFPEDLERFTAFEVVNDYINARNNHIYDPFIDPIDEILYFKINMETLRKKYYFADCDVYFYHNVFDVLTASLKLANIGINNVDYQERMKYEDGDKVYDYTDVIFYRQPNCLLNKNNFKTLLHDYFCTLIPSMADNINYDVLALVTEKWINKALLKEQLSDNLSVKEPQKKVIKI